MDKPKYMTFNQITSESIVSTVIHNGTLIIATNSNLYASVMRDDGEVYLNKMVFIKGELE